MDRRIRLVVIDPYPIFRQGVVQAIARSEDMVLVGEGATAADARRLARESAPDILIMDISIEDGIDATRELSPSGCKVVILTALEDVLTISRALSAGANGYILKGVSSVELLAALRGICAGKPYVTLDLASRLLIEAKGNALVQDPGLSEVLSTRETQVLRHISKGRTNKEIAAELGLKMGTVKYYITQAFKKLNVDNRLQALQVFKKHGCD